MKINVNIYKTSLNRLSLGSSSSNFWFIFLHVFFLPSNTYCLTHNLDKYDSIDLLFFQLIF